MSILDHFKLDGQTALVTGCKRGIGKAMAIALAEAGADIVGVSATLENEGSDVGQAVTDKGRKFKGYACDFSDRPALYRFITQVKSDFPQIDILINNAGTIIRAPAVEHPDEDWDKVVEVNLSAQFILSRELHRRGIYPPVDVMPSLSRLMGPLLSEGKTREDHADVMNQLYSAYARGKNAKELAVVLGESALSEADILFVK